MRKMFCFIVIPILALSLISLILVSSVHDRKTVKAVKKNDYGIPILQPQPVNSEERYTSLSIETDFGGKMTYRVAGKKVTEIVISFGVSTRETIEVFSYPEENSWVYTLVERNFAWDGEEQQYYSTLTRRINVSRYYFSGNNLLKSICVLGDKSDINIENVLASRNFFLNLAKQNKASADVEFLKKGFPEWAKSSSNKN